MSDLKITDDGKIEICIEAIFDSLKKESVKELFIIGVMHGYFNDFINELCEGEVYEGQCLTTFQLGDHGLQSDFINDIRENIVRKISNLEKASFDFQNELYKKTVKKYGDSCEKIASLESQIKLLKEREEVLMKCAEFYSDDNPECSDDWETFCSPKCEDALKRSGHHHVNCEDRYGKLARATLEKLKELK